MYNIHKMCFDCVIDMEGKLKIQGKYDEYERNAIANNAEAYVQHLESYLMDALNKSIIEENYEIAAKLRDRIKKLNAKKI